MLLQKKLFQEKISLKREGSINDKNLDFRKWLKIAYFTRFWPILALLKNHFSVGVQNLELKIGPIVSFFVLYKLS
tara:strand:- start:206 stop:430 length:225 start_codon:yes stop_codon:yes gene_type:complete